MIQRFSFVFGLPMSPMQWIGQSPDWMKRAQIVWCYDVMACHGHRKPSLSLCPSHTTELFSTLSPPACFILPKGCPLNREAGNLTKVSGGDKGKGRSRSGFPLILFSPPPIFPSGVFLNLQSACQLEVLTLQFPGRIGGASSPPKNHLLLLPDAALNA